MKHGKAKRVMIGLKPVESNIVLSITDNGMGFSQQSMPSKGLGLRIMNYRAQKIGGSFDIRAGEDGGTVVTCTVHNHLRKAEFGRK